MADSHYLGIQNESAENDELQLLTQHLFSRMLTQSVLL